MDNIAQTSFVPKRPIIPTDNGFRPKTKTSFFMLIAIAIFLIAVLLTGGLFFYKIVLTRQNESKKVKIEEAIDKFDPDLTKQLTLLRSRLDAAKQLLQSHEAFTAFLALLQQNTVQSVRFSDLSYRIISSEQISISMKGEANSYAVVAFQSDVLGTNENLQSVVFSDLALNEKGIITFTVKADIDPAAIAYVRTIDAGLPRDGDTETDFVVEMPQAPPLALPAPLSATSSATASIPAATTTSP